MKFYVIFTAIQFVLLVTEWAPLFQQQRRDGLCGGHFLVNKGTSDEKWTGQL